MIASDSRDRPGAPASRRHPPRLAWSLALAALLAGCGSDDETSQPSPTHRPTRGIEPTPGIAYPVEQAEISWFSCSLFEGAEDGRAECASTTMPLSWDDPDGPTIDIYAKRLRSTEPAHTQLWLLQGGPGASGVITMPSYMDRFHELMPGLDVYTIDHRGTGYSARLECPAAETPESPSGTSISSAEMPACLEYLRAEKAVELDGLRATWSAVDLAAYIHGSRQAAERVIVWGGSYGTYWAQRYLQVAPAQADGVVIEGIVPPDGTFISYDEYANRAGEDFMALCAADAFCAAKLGPAPWQRLGEVLEQMENGHCAQIGASRQNISLLLAYLLYFRRTHNVVPAVIHRLARCEPEDRQAVVHLFNYMFGDDGAFNIASYSILLQHHITFSEIWHHTDFDGVNLSAYFADLRANTYVAKNLGATKLALSDDWPVYADPQYDDGWAESSTPILMMQGRLDPASTWYEATPVGEHYAAEHQHFVTFPEAPHGVSSGTPLAGDPPVGHCGRQLWLEFMQDPLAVPDTSCMDSVLPIDFRGTVEQSQLMLGTNDFWYLESGGPKPPPPPPPGDWTAQHQALRAALRLLPPPPPEHLPSWLRPAR